jgi:hypothetical protein
MIPRTVQMATEVAAIFTPTQLEDYGNIILNGYLESVPNTTNKKAWQYQETTTAPVDLPSLTQVTPALRGWTTNYMQYYTQLPVNGYGQVPGNPTMFEYTVHSYSATVDPRWAQTPRRSFQNQVSSVTLPQYINNPEVIQYSFIHPISDNLVAPPIDVL